MTLCRTKVIVFHGQLKLHESKNRLKMRANTCTKLPLLFPVGWISRRAQKGFWPVELDPFSFHLLPSHIVCYSATSFFIEVMLVVAAAVFLNTSVRKLILLERKALHAKRSVPYLSWTVANWAGSAGLLTLSPFLGQHGGMMTGSRISWGCLKSPISQESFLHTVLPNQTSPLALDANGAAVPLVLHHACARQSLLPMSIPCAQHGVMLRSHLTKMS